MKKLFLIISLLFAAQKLEAQNIPKNERLAHTIDVSSAVSPAIAENSGYRVFCQQDKKNWSFEVISPKSDKAEVKLVNTSGEDICIIYKGVLHEGKNTFSLASKKVASGTYYVVSKLSSGEQFADKVVIGKP